jgi:hypothetical protein
MSSLGWKGNPYFPISERYNQLFGEKVYKIPVTTVDDCPNRRGLKGMETCIFCDVWGSAARSEAVTMNLKDQIQKYRALIQKKFKAKKFLVYFQAYTNSFEKIETLRAQFEACLEFEDVVGFVVGTRPDCISPKLFDLWQEFHEKKYVSVEIGAQSFDDKQLEFMKRGHDAKSTITAIRRIQENTDVDLGLHLMFGWPGETEQDVIDAAHICNDLPISNVKLHNLHVLTDTPLANLYFDNKFTPIELNDYANLVVKFIENLKPDIAVHRLAALASRHDELIAPDWTKLKMQTFQTIIDEFKKQNSFQGKALINQLSAEQCTLIPKAFLHNMHDLKTTFERSNL